MRPNTLSPLAIASTVTAIVTLLGFGACAGSRSGSNPCLDKCTARAGTSLERSTCELECKPTAAAPTQPAPSIQPTPTPASDPGQPQPAQPVATGPKRYAGDTGPRQAPPGGPAVRPAVTPALGTTTPSTPPGPSMAERQQQRGLCESSCDAENSSNSDRATCRLQCAQITDRPAATSIPPSTGGPSRPNTGTTQPAPVDRGSITACEATCNSESTPATDRATCRLNCNATGSRGPAPTTQKVFHGDAPDTSSRRSEVIRSSGGVVPQSGSSGSSGYALTPADAQKAAQCATRAQQCSSACSTRQAPCTRGCDEGKLSATDRATCKLTCDSNVDGCRDDCRIAEGTCRGPAVQR